MAACLFLAGLVCGRTTLVRSVQHGKPTRRLAVWMGGAHDHTPYVAAAEHLLLELAVRVLAAAYYSSVLQAHWQAMVPPGEPAQDGAGRWWWLQTMVHLSQCVREFSLTVWGVLAPAHYLRNSRTARRVGLATKVIALLVVAAPGSPFTGDVQHKRRLAMAAIYVLRALLHHSDLEEFSMQAGILTLAAFVGHAWSVGQQQQLAPGSLEPIDWPARALASLAAYCAMVALKFACLQLMQQATTPPAEELAPLFSSCRASPRETCSAGATMAHAACSTRRPSTVMEDVSARSTATTATTMTAGNMLPGTISRDEARAPGQDPLLQLPSFRSLASTGVAPAPAADTRSAMATAPVVVVRLTGAAIYTAYACVALERVWDQHTQHGTSAAWHTAASLWPSVLLAPLAVCIQLLSLRVALGAGRTPTRAPRMRAWLVWLASYAPLVTRLLMLLVEQPRPLHSSSSSSTTTSNSSSSSSSHGNGVISTPVHVSTFLYITLSLLTSGASRLTLQTTAAGLLLLVTKARVLGLLPAWDLSSPARAWASLQQLGQVTRRHPQYPAIVLAAALVQPVLQHWQRRATRSASPGRTARGTGYRKFCLNSEPGSGPMAALDHSRVWPLTESAETVVLPAPISAVPAVNGSCKLAAPGGAAAVKHASDPGAAAGVHEGRPSQAAPKVARCNSGCGQPPARQPAAAARMSQLLQRVRAAVHGLRVLAGPRLHAVLSRAATPDVLGSGLLLWVRTRVTLVSLASTSSHSTFARAGHWASVAYSAALLLCSLRRAPIMRSRRSLMWGAQLLGCALLQHLALHVAYLQAADLGGAGRTAVTSTEYMSHPVLSLLLTSFVWPQLGLQLSTYKLLVAVRLSLSLAMICSFLPTDLCLEEPVVLGLLGLQILVAMLALFVLSHEAARALPRLANRAAAAHKMDGRTPGLGIRVALLFLRTPERTACTLITAVYLLLSRTSHAPAAWLLQEDLAAMKSASAAAHALAKLVLSVPASGAAPAGPPQLLLPEGLIKPLILAVLAMVAIGAVQALDLLATSHAQRQRWYAEQVASVKRLALQRLDLLSHEALVEALQAEAAPLMDASLGCLLLLEHTRDALDTAEGLSALVDALHTLDRYLPSELGQGDVELLTGLLLQQEGRPLVVQDLQATHMGPAQSEAGGDSAEAAAHSAHVAELQRLLDTMYVSSVTLVPIVLDGAVCGGLVALSPDPCAHDAAFTQAMQHWASHVGAVLLLSQALSKARAGDLILEDVMPRQVAEQLRKRALFAGGPAEEAGRDGHRVSCSRETTLIDALDALDPDFQAAPTSPKRGSGGGAQLRAWMHGGPASSGRIPALHGAAGPRATLQERARAPSGSSPGLSTSTPQLSTLVYKQWHESVTVLFCDIVGYTSMSQELEPEQVMLLLHELFTKYDRLADKWGVYKVETIGDCYMACMGVTHEDPRHAELLFGFAVEMVHAASTVLNPLTDGPIAVRVGLHSGRVMSGIVGLQRARYCLFGDTVNTASRMESTGVANMLQVSEATHSLLPADMQPLLSYRGQTEIKGKGLMHTYLGDPFAAPFLCGARPEARMWGWAGTASPTPSSPVAAPTR